MRCQTPPEHNVPSYPKGLMIVLDLYVSAKDSADGSAFYWAHKLESPGQVLIREQFVEYVPSAPEEELADEFERNQHG